MAKKARRFLRRAAPYEASLSAYCRRLLRSSRELEDALQETLVVAYRDFDDPGEREWRRRLFRTATWTCFNLNRRHRREAQPPPEAAPAHRTLEREWTYEELLRDPSSLFDSLGDDLARACLRLTEKERAILLLKSIGELSCPEIAEVLDLPLGTAQGLLTRARTKMRTHLVDLARARGAAAAPLEPLERGQGRTAKGRRP